MLDCSSAITPGAVEKEEDERGINEALRAQVEEDRKAKMRKAGEKDEHELLRAEVQEGEVRAHGPILLEVHVRVDVMIVLPMIVGLLLARIKLLRLGVASCTAAPASV